VTKHYTENPEAYQLYLKGRYYWNKRTQEAIEIGIRYFQQAIEKDPSYALAYAGLADCYVIPAGPLPPNEKMPKAKAAAQKALEIDDSLAEAHTSLGRVLATYDWDWPGAKKEFQRAIELNPRYSVAHQWYGGYWQAIGRFDESQTEKKRAQELDPLSSSINFDVGLTFYYTRQYDQAIGQLRKMMEMDPSFPPPQNILAAAYEQKGMYDEAIAGFQQAITLSTGFNRSISMAGLGHVYAVYGKKSAARKVLSELKQLSTQEYVPAWDFALIYAGLGENDQAFAWLDKAYDERSFNMTWLNNEPRWDSLRSDARYLDLVHRIGFRRDS